MRFLLLMAATTLLAACSETGPNISGIEPINISRVEVRPERDSLYAADPLFNRQRAYVAFVYSRTGTLYEGAQVVWSTSDPEIATIDASGVLTAISAGTVRVFASAGKRGEATLVVLPGRDPSLPLPPQIPEPQPEPPPPPPEPPLP